MWRHELDRGVHLQEDPVTKRSVEVILTKYEKSVKSTKEGRGFVDITMKKKTYSDYENKWTVNPDRHQNVGHLIS